MKIIDKRETLKQKLFSTWSLWLERNFCKFMASVPRRRASYGNKISPKIKLNLKLKTEN